MPAHDRPQTPEASPIIISESATHIVIAIEVPRATLERHERFLRMLLEAAHRPD
jgi:hypothetical protein